MAWRSSSEGGPARASAEPTPAASDVHLVFRPKTAFAVASAVLHAMPAFAFVPLFCFILADSLANEVPHHMWLRFVTDWRGALYWGVPAAASAYLGLVTVRDVLFALRAWVELEGHSLRVYLGSRIVAEIDAGSIVALWWRKRQVLVAKHTTEDGKLRKTPIWWTIGPGRSQLVEILTATSDLVKATGPRGRWRPAGELWVRKDPEAHK